MGLIKLDPTTIVNTKYIVQVSVTNLNKLRRERGLQAITPEQRAQLDDKYWQVSVYFRSDGDGYNPQAYSKRFYTLEEANKWIEDKIGL